MTGRFSSASWANKSLQIAVIGLGGTGRGIAEMLCLYGHNVTVWDGDIVEEHNCLPQGYFKRFIGQKKVTAFKHQLILQYPGFDIKCNGLENMFSETSNLIGYNIVIACVDNFATRRLITGALNGQSAYIDTRMLAENFEIYYFKKGFENIDTLAWYMETIEGNDAETIVPCTYRQTIHVSKILHGIVIGMVNQHILGIDIPKKTTYDALLNIWHYDT